MAAPLPQVEEAIGCAAGTAWASIRRAFQEFEIESQVMAPSKRDSPLAVGRHCGLCAMALAMSHALAAGPPVLVKLVEAASEMLRQISTQCLTCCAASGDFGM
mmetsp:Transcript_8487/g.19968  ORF Transcript_8487/g.19968 Transcript_8487/m.19968 type:complete len:103 (-) Transcript_8487:938-1246(-)